jgi:hypothetical protein
MRPSATLAAGVGLVVLGTLGYAVGVVVAYPGRAFAVTGVMVGIALLAVGSGRSSRREEGDRP